MQLGPTARGMLYIQLSNFPKHYLVIVVTDDEFRYALISVNVLPDSTYQSMVMEDIAWLDLRRIHGEDSADTTRIDDLDALGSGEQKQEGTGRNETRSGPYVAFFFTFASERIVDNDCSGNFNLKTQVLRELYAYCW